MSSSSHIARDRNLAARSARPAPWALSLSLLLLAVVPAVAGIARLWALMAGGPVTLTNARFFEAPLPVALHILSALPFAVLGALQVSSSVRRQRSRWHRLVGRVLVVLGAVSALTGLWMAHFYPWPQGDGTLLYSLRLVVGTGMLVALVLAVHAVRRKRFAAHGAWMLRAYALGMGAGTQVLTHIPYLLLVGQPGEAVRTVLMGAGWFINLVVAEWVIRHLAQPLFIPSPPA